RSADAYGHPHAARRVGGDEWARAAKDGVEFELARRRSIEEDQSVLERLRCCLVRLEYRHHAATERLGNRVRPIRYEPPHRRELLRQWLGQSGEERFGGTSGATEGPGGGVGLLLQLQAVDVK